MEANNIKKISIFIVLSLYFLPVFFLTDGYRDDFSRNINGDYVWDTEGRPVAYMIIKIINLFGDLTNPSPLSQMLSIIISYFACVIIMKRFFYQGGVVSAITPSLIFLTPFFIQNISYQYDILPMVFSIFFLILSIETRKNIYSIILISLSLSTYQPAISIYPFILLINYFENKDKNEIKNRIFSLIVSMLIYRIIILNIFMSADYGKSASNMLVPNSIVNIIHIKDNLFDYFSYYISHYVDFGLYIISFLSLTLLFLLFKSRNKTRNVILFLFSFSFVFLFCLFDKVILQPRVFIWSGGAVVTSIYLINKNNSLRLISKSITICFCLYSIVISSFYSLASYNINKIEESILATSNIKYENLNRIYVFGYPDRGYIANKIIRKYKFLDAMLTPNLYSWQATFYAKSKGYDIYIGKYNGDEISCVNKIYSNNKYSMHDIGGNLILNFKNINCR
ncbi:glucosyltransferase domain-containing protein [Proteus mirabilis]|uniref:glucosyltransferase domain-containing protein n=1 Tax=Proteus mirabilis TaxID=584 RepID=UPI0013EECAAD|nr:glucosyltransferase domain-containing protein [Proteus mirabilis]NGX92010.1 hypothetical protein [Proteus mirabilis]